MNGPEITAWVVFACVQGIAVGLPLGVWWVQRRALQRLKAKHAALLNIMFGALDTQLEAARAARARTHKGPSTQAEKEKEVVVVAFTPPRG